MKGAEIELRSRRARALRGHPWVFAGEVKALLPAKHDGEAVVCRDGRGRVLGTGLYNSKSSIVWRKFSEGEVDLDRRFLRERLDRASSHRSERLAYGRLVWSEADDLPGLVIDRFGAHFVVQALVPGMDRRLGLVTDWLRERWGAEEIILRNDAPVREREGLRRELRTASGKRLEASWYCIEGMDYWLDLERGQKTGFFLDQREEHLAVGAMAAGRRVLDAFCNQGAFALHCARGGARGVHAIDISEEAIAGAARNAARNGHEVEWECANVFDVFTDRRDACYDLIVLDPPSFARRRDAVEGAMRGYKELNLRAIRMLSPGGLLATYSCSQNVSRELFMEMLTEAALDARRRVEIIRLTGQPADHPARLGIPESAYLKGAILKVWDG